MILIFSLLSALRSPVADVEGGSPHPFALQAVPPPDEHVEPAGFPTRISVDPNAGPSEQYAARELHGYLSKLCPSRQLAIGNPLPGRPRQLAVGRDAALALGAPAHALAQQGETTLLDTSLLAGSGSTIVSGGPVRGSLYSSYQLLEHLGYRFLAADETIVPKACPSRLPRFERRESTPDFEYRDNNQINILLDPAWATRVGYNGDTSNQTATLGEHVGYADPPGFVHSVYNLVSGRKQENQNAHPYETYREHPEWFYPRWAGANGQVCWSNGQLVDHLIERVKAVLRAQPNRRIVSVSQMDNGNYCRDAVEQEIAQREGSQIAPMLIAVNRIADAIKDEHPDVAIDTLAYQYSRAPPTSDLRPRPNVIIRLCAIEGDFAHPLSHPHNAKFLADLRGWMAKTRRIYVWDYNTDFDGYFVPYPNVHTLVPNLKTYHEHGVRGLFEEGNYNSKGGDLTQLKDYLMAKALWNSTVDPNALMHEFTEGYYGPLGGVAVRQYVQLMERGVTDDYHMPYAFAGEKPTVPFMKPTLLLAAANVFADALNATRATYGARHKYVLRLEETSMPVMYVSLFRWEELQEKQRSVAAAAAKTRGRAVRSLERLLETSVVSGEDEPLDPNEAAAERWPFDGDKRAQYKEFQRLYTQVGVTKLNEHADKGKDFEWLERKLFPSNGRRSRLMGIFLELGRAQREAASSSCSSPRLGRCYRPLSPEQLLREQRHQ